MPVLLLIPQAAFHVCTQSKVPKQTHYIITVGFNALFLGAVGGSWFNNDFFYLTYLKWKYYPYLCKVFQGMNIAVYNRNLK